MFRKTPSASSSTHSLALTSSRGSGSSDDGRPLSVRDLVFEAPHRRDSNLSVEDDDLVPLPTEPSEAKGWDGAGSSLRLIIPALCKHLSLAVNHNISARYLAVSNDHESAGKHEVSFEVRAEPAPPVRPGPAVSRRLGKRQTSSKTTSTSVRAPSTYQISWSPAVKYELREWENVIGARLLTDLTEPDGLKLRELAERGSISRVDDPMPDLGIGHLLADAQPAIARKRNNQATTEGEAIPADASLVDKQALVSDRASRIASRWPDRVSSDSLLFAPSETDVPPRWTHTVSVDGGKETKTFTFASEMVGDSSESSTVGSFELLPDELGSKGVPIPRRSA